MRRMRRRRFRSSKKGYDWIVTTGDNIITLNTPTVDSTLAEFPLVTPDEVKEIGEPIMVERVVGHCWFTAPQANGAPRGLAQIGWGIRVASTDASSSVIYLPIDVLADTGMDASWMLLRHHLVGIMFPQGSMGSFYANNIVPNLAPGGRHAPQGGPAFDINVKRKMHDTDVLTLSVAVNTIVTWVVAQITDSYSAGDEVGVALHIRTLCRGLGR